MNDMDQVRSHVARLLDWGDAHVDFEKAVNGVPFTLQGMVPAGLPYSPWQLLEHIHLTQYDILDFCRNAEYAERAWPDDYWPAKAGPASINAWEECVDAIRHDRNELKQLATNTSIDLLSRVPAGNGQTFLRELLLVADHTSYHLGQLVVVRRALGNWTA